MTELPSAEQTHVVRVERRRGLRSDTLEPDVLQELNAVWRATPWYRVPWTYARFRTAVLDLLRRRAPGGLAFVGRGLPLETPPPFTEPFEPIEFGSGDDQFDVLSGPNPTREERVARVASWIGGIVGGVVVLAFVIGWISGGPRVAPAMILSILAVAAIIALVILLSGLGPKWYLLPGAVAVVRAHGDTRTRLRLYTRHDSCAVLRYVSTGKTVILMLELWSTHLRPVRRPVKEREALAFLAAWQSPLPPPEPERLGELVSA